MEREKKTKRNRLDWLIYHCTVALSSDQNSSCPWHWIFIELEKHQRTGKQSKCSARHKYSIELYLCNETPGNNSMLALRAARFNAVIPLTDKHEKVSSLSKQLAIDLRNDDDSSAVGAAAAIAKTADRTINAFILSILFLIVVSLHKTFNFFAFGFFFRAQELFTSSVHRMFWCSWWWWQQLLYSIDRKFPAAKPSCSLWWCVCMSHPHREQRNFFGIGQPCAFFQFLNAVRQLLLKFTWFVYSIGIGWRSYDARARLRFPVLRRCAYANHASASLLARYWAICASRRK